MYLTPVQLASGQDMLLELAELFSVPVDLLEMMLAGQSPGEHEWSPPERAAGVNALDVIKQTIIRASGEIDAYLARRGYSLPVDAKQFPIVGSWALAITRYLLHPQREGTQDTTGRIERDYRDAIKALQFVTEGKLSLGAGDPLAVPPSNTVHVSGPGRQSSRQTLGRL